MNKQNIRYEITAPLLFESDVVVCGGGISGFAAAASAANNGMSVTIIEAGGYLGGTMTQTLVPYYMDCKGKGGIVREIIDEMNRLDLTCPRSGPRVDKNNKRIHGYIMDTEGMKYYLDKRCRELGIRVLYYSRVTGAQTECKSIKSILISSDSGNYSVKGKIYIDATGNGNLAVIVGCRCETGSPDDGTPQPMTMQALVSGYPKEFDSIDSEKEKYEYNDMLEKYGIELSARQFGLIKMPSLNTWLASCNQEYNVHCDNIEELSRATANGRIESMEIIRRHSEIRGYENMFVEKTSDRIGMREGRRILGEYRLSAEDIMSGRRFEDGICLVNFIVDVHKLSREYNGDNHHGIEMKPYNIPYRCLVPLDCDNLLLSGRCMSGDFYPHASYRVMGNMTATGEAAGYAASVCLKNAIKPKEVNGKEVSAYMSDRGYSL